MYSDDTRSNAVVTVMHMHYTWQWELEDARTCDNDTLQRSACTRQWHYTTQHDDLINTRRRATRLQVPVGKSVVLGRVGEGVS